MTIEIGTIPIDEEAIEQTLAASRDSDPAHVRGILDRARERAGLTPATVSQSRAASSSAGKSPSPAKTVTQSRPGSSP